MYHKGIIREQVIETAVALVEENGLENFSMHQLASALGIRTASLYKHVSGMDDAILDIFLRAIALQTQALMDALAGKRGDEAVIAFATAYRGFAQQHPGLYHIILDKWNPNN